MFEALHKLLLSAKQDELQFTKLKAQKEEIDFDLAHLQNKKQQFEKKLKKEEKDVVSLQKFSFKYLIYSLFGLRKKKLNKEEKELLVAQLIYENCTKELELLKEQSKVVAERLAQVEHWELRYDQALQWKQNILLKQTGHSQHKKLLSLVEQLAQKYNEHKELDEALKTGKVAYQYLKEVVLGLSKAKGWANWDTFANLELVADINKNSWIGYSRQYMGLFKKYLQLFNQELKDVNISANISLEIGAFLGFTDVFWDNFFSDFIIRNRISNALKQATHVQHIIHKLWHHLNDRYEKLKTEINNLEDQRIVLLEQLK